MNKNTENNDITVQNFDVFFKHASLAIVITNSRGEIIVANPFLEKLFGYDSFELIGQKVEVLMPNSFREKHEQHRHNYLNNPVNRPMGFGLDLFAKKKDGSQFHVEVSLASYTIEEEKFVVGFINDITRRKKDQAEIIKLNTHLEEIVEQRTEELTHTLNELEKSKDQLEVAIQYQKAILENAGVMIFATDVKGVIRFFNTEASVITGYSPEEVVDKATAVLFHRPQDIDLYRKELMEEFEISAVQDYEVLTGKAQQSKFRQYECYYVGKDGGWISVSMTYTPLTDKNNQAIGYLGVVVDISQRKKAEADLIKALRKEKKLGELKSRFVSMASHEFRTPLSTVLSSAYLIEKYTRQEEQEKRKKHINRIVSSVNTLSDILNDFLSVGKIDEGKIPLRLTEFDLKNKVAGMVQDMYANLKKNQWLDYSHHGDTIVHLDPALLKHIVINLISNAIKFSPEDSSIQIETAVQDDCICLSVKDHGIGIPKEDQVHLSERFFRGTNAINIQGTGLGLHIVSKYVQRLNGTIKCTSELDKGTTFDIIFKPIKKP